jgi:hypothetical protein
MEPLNQSFGITLHAANFFENLIVTQLFRKLSTTHANQQFIPVFTDACCWFPF